MVSRRLAEVPPVNLFKRYETFHLDHVVSPYANPERKKSQALLCNIPKARNPMFNLYSFAFAVARGNDIAKMFEPYSKNAVPPNKT